MLQSYVSGGQVVYIHSIMYCCIHKVMNQSIIMFVKCMLYNLCLYLPYSGEPIPTVEYTPEEINTW